MSPVSRSGAVAERVGPTSGRLKLKPGRKGARSAAECSLSLETKFLLFSARQERDSVLSRSPGRQAFEELGPGSFWLPRLVRRRATVWSGTRSFLLFRLSASLLSIAFTGQGLFDPEFLAWLQIEGVPFDLSDDVFLQDLPLEAAEGVLPGFSILQHYLSQLPPPSRPDSSSGIIRPLPRAEGPLPGSEGSRAAPVFPSVPCRV